MCKKSTWARKFDDINYTKLTVESGDKTYKKEYTREQINGKINGDDLLKDKSKIKKAGGANVWIYHDGSKEDKDIGEIDKAIEENRQKKIKEREALLPASDAFDGRMSKLREMRLQ